jgi:ribosomal protein S11
MYRRKVNLLLGHGLKLRKTCTVLYKCRIAVKARRNRLKLFVAFLYAVSYLLKIRRYPGLFIKVSCKLLSLKKFFSKIFCLKVYKPYFLFLNVLFSQYSGFYKRLTLFETNLFFIKYTVGFLKFFSFKILNLYRKFSAFKLRESLLKKGFISQYCRSILNFKKIQQTKFFSTLKKCLLFLKKKVLLIYKYRPSLYLAKLSSIYRGYLGHILGSEYLSSKGTDALDFLFLKSTFFNFLKSLNVLDLFYKECYYNIYIKKIKYNFYITVTDRKGDVIFSNSSGKVGLLKKKQKKSTFAIDLVIRPVIKALLRLNILSVKNFFCPIALRYTFLRVKYFFLRLGVTIDNVIIFNSKPHNFYYKKLKKLKRM